MKKIVLIFFFFSHLFGKTVIAQHLKPGFDKLEYIELLKLSARTTANPAYFNTLPAPQHFRMIYQSPVMGLDNLWDLWVNTNNVAVISIRGTTENSVSWLGNFYAAMVPAKGEMQISETEIFKYELASDPKAAVHVGWLVSTAFLSKDILPKIDSIYKAGVKDIIIMGHSQGGGIAYLLTSYLHNLQKQNLIPSNIRFKTYCSAGPNPGNLYYAYEYEAMTQYGWAFNVVNSADWVPEVPMSIQTLSDFNTTNPFVHANAMIKKQKFPNNIVLKYMYNRLDKPTRRAQKRYQKYLGKLTSKFVTNHLKGFKPPEYYNSNNYVRTGTMIILLADSAYYKSFPQSSEKIFINHFHPPYLYLAEKLPDTGTGDFRLRK